MAAISVNDNIMMCMCLHEYLISVVQTHNWNSIECRFSGFAALLSLQNCTFQILAMKEGSIFTGICCSKGVGRMSFPGMGLSGIRSLLEGVSRG